MESSLLRMPTHDINIHEIAGSWELDESTFLAGKENHDRQGMTSMIFEIILKDWMHGFGEIYSREDYGLLHDQISMLTTNELPIKFLIPGFPAKSSNKKEKVFGVHADFAEYLALRSLLATARKIEAVYKYGVEILILSDFHTFDKYVSVSEDEYKIYHQSFKEMIINIGASDVIKVLALSDFPEFNSTPLHELSGKLFRDFGSLKCTGDFFANMGENPEVRDKYSGLRIFMQKDLAEFLPGRRNSNAAKRFIKDVAKGMIFQGIALDEFLKKQTLVTNCIRLSIHNHHPRTGKMALNLYKHSAATSGFLRTPWHHAVAFDSLAGKFIVDHKSSLTAFVKDGELLVKVQMDQKDWFFLVLQTSADFVADSGTIEIRADLIRDGCGLIISNNTKDRSGKAIHSNMIHPDSLRNLIKEFGVVILRGFSQFQCEAEFIDSYNRELSHGILHWRDFGALKKINPNREIPGFVNSHEALPIHFDVSNPPPYMAISQADYQYKDYIPREFVLYCRESSGSEGGATTFVDASSASQAVNGKVKERWRNTVLAVEVVAANKTSKQPYFGGKGSVFKYPVMHQCPWTEKDVLRWLQSWPKSDASQNVLVSVDSAPSTPVPAVEDLESEIEAVAFDERFFFTHAYEDGDLVYVNNYTMLHGRNEFAGGRELWRLQAIPPSDNLPEYFTEMQKIC